MLPIDPIRRPVTTSTEPKKVEHQKPKKMSLEKAVEKCTEAMNAESALVSAYMSDGKFSTQEAKKLQKIEKLLARAAEGVADQKISRADAKTINKLEDLIATERKRLNIRG